VIGHLLHAPGYAPNGLAIATALSAVLSLFIGTAVLARVRASVVGVLFSLITIATGGWLGAFALMYASRNERLAFIWAHAGFFFIPLIPAAVYHFTATFLGRGRDRRLSLWICWVLGAMMSITAVVTDLSVARMRHFTWGWYPLAGPISLASTVVGAVMLFESVRLYLEVKRQARWNETRRQARTLLVAYAFGALALVDYLPSTGYDVVPLSPLAVLGFVTLAGIAVWRFQFIDVTPEFAASQILETMKGLVIVMNVQGKISVVNKAVCAKLGYVEEELRGMPMTSIVDGPDALNFAWIKSVSSGGVREQPMVWLTQSGMRVDVLVTASILRDPAGSPAGIVYVASDVTMRKRAEEAIRESEQRYRLLFDANPLPMWVYDSQTLEFVAVNDAAVQHYGYPREEFLGMSIGDIKPADDLQAIRETGELHALDQPRLSRHRKRDGSFIDVEVTSFSFEEHGRRARLVIAVDVTERRRAEDAVRQSEERYRELFENANDIVFTHDLNGHITSLNKAGMLATGYAREELMDRNIYDLVVPEFVERARQAMRDKVEGRAGITAYELEIVGKGGQVVPVEVSTRLIMRDGKPVGVQGIARDTSERRAAEARYRLLFERNLAGVYRTTADGHVLDCNDAYARIFGYDSRAELLAHGAIDIYFDADERRRVLARLHEQKSLTSLEVRMRRKDGSPVWVLENVTLLPGDPEVMEGTLLDITDRKLAQERIEYQAYHDALTALPNRVLFRDRLTVALAHARRAGKNLGVMFLDLDQFKLVNDTLGHTIGDGLLQAVATRLTNCVRGEDTVARMGGDEFTILLAELTDSKGATTVAQKVLESISRPFIVDDHELFVTTSIGIAMFPGDGEDAETLLRNSDSAMYRAKELGRNNFQQASPATFAQKGRLLLESSLHHAFEREEFVVHYQPMLEIWSGRVVGAEALIRWQHPENGLMAPDDFIGIAEESRLILPIGEWVLRTACEQMKRWHEAGRKLRIGVNLSARQFQQRDLARTVARVLEQTGLEPEYLDLEITETTAMQNAELSLTTMRRLKEMGVRISIDDFGTGYSSLAYLKRFPIDCVKIDQNFVRDVVTNTTDSAIISAVISMARALKLRVVAEGVETEAQLAFLRSEQCAEMQGFLYSRPVPAHEFELVCDDGRAPN
jgi:diguanylate cyclase (GGDEF)-like protein/PAS domain S-box-containing protein